MGSGGVERVGTHEEIMRVGGLVRVHDVSVCSMKFISFEKVHGAGRRECTHTLVGRLVARTARCGKEERVC